MVIATQRDNETQNELAALGLSYKYLYANGTFLSMIHSLQSNYSSFGLSIVSLMHFGRPRFHFFLITYHTGCCTRPNVINAIIWCLWLRRQPTPSSTYSTDMCMDIISKKVIPTYTVISAIVLRNLRGNCYNKSRYKFPCFAKFHSVVCRLSQTTQGSPQFSPE